MTTAVAPLRPRSVRGRLLRGEVSVRDNRGREGGKERKPRVMRQTGPVAFL